MLEIVARRTCASRLVAPPTACAPTRRRPISADPGWLPIICPVCHTIAHALPNGPDEMSVACTCCTPYRLTHAGERILTTTPDPIDRTDLSRTLRDARAMVGEEWPLIDSLSARTLIALSALRLQFATCSAYETTLPRAMTGLVTSREMTCRPLPRASSAPVRPAGLTGGRLMARANGLRTDWVQDAPC